MPYDAARWTDIDFASIEGSGLCFMARRGILARDIRRACIDTVAVNRDFPSLDLVPESNALLAPPLLHCRETSPLTLTTISLILMGHVELFIGLFSRNVTRRRCEFIGYWHDVGKARIFVA